MTKRIEKLGGCPPFSTRPPSTMTDNVKLMEGVAQARAACAALVDLPDAEWNIIPEMVHYRAYQRGEQLIRAGEAPTHFFFILSGLVRCFYATIDGKEFNSDFFAENEFAGSFVACILGGPSRFSVEALEPCEVLMVSTDAQERLHDINQGWERLRRIHAEHVVLKKERREASFLLDDAERRYLDFLANHPHLEGRLPQYHIASYIGVTDVALSRIKRRLGKMG